jgi:membrane associated rhomboid family serine protease
MENLTSAPYFYAILAITILCSLIGFSNHNFFDKNKFVPYVINRNFKNHWHRFITSGFLHADFLHLALNMYVFYSFGNYLNFTYQIYFGKLGNSLFVFLYLSAILVAHISTYIKYKDDYGYASIGASGAVSAIVYSFILIEPEAQLSVMGIPMPAIVFGIIYLAVEFFLGRRNRSGINHDAHFWGAVYGFLFTGLIKPELVSIFIEKIKMMIG